MAEPFDLLPPKMPPPSPGDTVALVLLALVIVAIARTVFA